MQLVGQKRAVAPRVLRVKPARGVRGRRRVDDRQLKDALQDVPRFVLVLVEVHRELPVLLEAEKFPTVGLRRGKDFLVPPALLHAHAR